MDNATVIKSRAPKEDATALLSRLREMVKQRRVEHEAIVKVIAEHNKNGVRYFGGALESHRSLEKLKIHVAALDTRRRTQRELQVIVPLMRRILACVQIRSETSQAFDTALNPFRAELARWAHSTGKQGLYEKPVAIDLISAFPDLLGPPVAAVAKPAATMPSSAPAFAPAPVRPQVDEKRLKLYDKITSAGHLTGKEIESLRVIFWGE